jgi:hypothetical protein
MPEFCSCGTQLAPDALFCHRCGKPQRDIVEPEIAPAAFVDTAPAVSRPPHAPPLNFRNPVAVRIALLVAVTATVLNLFLPLLAWLAAGFFAVFFYRRKTGLLVDVSSGVRMGWITGLLMFGPVAVILTAQLIGSATSGNLGNILREQMKNVPARDQMVQQMVGLFQTGPGITLLVLTSLGLSFVFITGLSMAGGALGAKLIGRDSQPPV